MDFLSEEEDLETNLNKASYLYEQFLIQATEILAKIDHHRLKRIVLPAKLIWQLGDIIFGFVGDLEKINFQIDNLYEHMRQEFSVKRKWLEKVIILRRYISDEKHIPDKLSWGYFEKGTRRKAEEIEKNPHGSGFQPSPGFVR